MFITIYKGQMTNLNIATEYMFIKTIVFAIIDSLDIKDDSFDLKVLYRY
jgi:hypothetical protein